MIFGGSVDFWRYKNEKEHFKTILGKRFEDSCLSPIFLWYKLSRSRLLSPESECTSCLTSWETTYDFRKLGKFRKICEMLGFVGQWPAG